MKNILKIERDISKLSDRAEEVSFQRDGNLIKQIIADLKQTILDYNLLSLSAPQLGYNKRIFVLNFSGDLRAFVNPYIKERKGLKLYREKDISLPDKEYFIARNEEIVAIYQTALGKVESNKFLDTAGELFQFEVDHLDGVLLQDYGLEVIDGFDALSAEAKQEVLKYYVDYLKELEQSFNKDIQSNAGAKQLQDAIDFTNGILNGTVKLATKEDLELTNEVKHDNGWK